MKHYLNNNYISASVVLYQNNEQDIIKLIDSFLHSSVLVKLFVIDNSPTNRLKESIISMNGVEYFSNPSNPGFGASHNFAIIKAMELSYKYHLIINPDITFGSNVIKEMVLEMENNIKIGMMMPKILNIDGSIQYLPKLLPSPLSLLIRKIRFPKYIYTNYLNRYELRKFSNDYIYNTPVLSGCFTILNLSAIKHIGIYDEKYFMYFEDWDLSRRMHKHYKTLYFPNVSVLHGYDSGANKSIKLLLIFIKSAIYYFNKWGWVFDKERRKINLSTLKQFK